MTLLKLTAERSLRTPTLSPYAGEPIVNWESYADIWPQACASCDAAAESSGEGNSSPPTYIYSTLAKVRPVFPSLTIEKEFYQVAPPDSGLPFDELFFQVLSKIENLYLAREMCWVLRIAAVDSYIIKPVSDEQVLYLVAASRPVENSFNEPLSTLVGPRGSVAPSAACNGLELPIVPASHFFFRTIGEYIKAITEAIGDSATEGNVLDLAGNLWEALINPGDTEAYRAINFVLTQYLGAYKDAYDLLYPSNSEDAYEFTGIESQPAILQGDRQIYDVIFTYQRTRDGQIKRRNCEVDLTTEFPYLAMYMANYIAS